MPSLVLGTSWTTTWGTVAQWAAVGATVLGFTWAITLHYLGRRRGRKEQATKVSFHYDGHDHKVRIANFGDMPILDVHLYDSANSLAELPGAIEWLPPGESRPIEIPQDQTFSDGDLLIQFTDQLGQRWQRKGHKKAKRVVRRIEVD